MKIIKTGSKGNAVVYHDSILVDIGVSYNLIKDYNLKLICLTHEHHDHINITTLTKYMHEHKNCRIACPEWMFEYVKDIENVDILDMYDFYKYNEFIISPFPLMHGDVENCGYRIIKDNYKIIHATDTNTLDHISAKNYNLYAIEHNYKTDVIDKYIQDKKEKGVYSYEVSAKERHLSYEKAQAWINKNNINGRVVELHKSTQNYE